MIVSPQRWSAALVASLLLVACSRQEPTVYPAKIGSGGITVEEFEQEVAYRRKANIPIVSKDTVLEEMVNRRVLAEQARAAGMEKEYEIKRAFEGILADRLRDKQIDVTTVSNTVSQAEIEARYQQEIKRYTQPAKARLALLTLQFPRTASAEQKKALEEKMAAARLKAMELPAETLEFGALAIDNSDDQISRYRGGDQGWFDEGAESRLPEEVSKAGFALEIGGISEVIRTTKGFFVVKKMDSRPAAVTPLEKIAETIRRRLLWEKKKDLEKNFVAEARRTLGVSLHPELLENISLQPTISTNQDEEAPPALP